MPIAIQVLSGDQLFLTKIGEANFRGVVHSWFERTLNIRCGDSGELYTVACRHLDNAPSTLIVNDSSMRSYDRMLGQAVSCTTDRLYIGSRIILSTAGAVHWTCALPEYPSSSRKLRINLPVMKQYTDGFGKIGGMKAAVQPGSRFEEEASRMLRDRAALFLSELYAGRKEHAVKAAQRLLGLGPGLTPSGDDFLVGVFAVMNLRGGPLHACQGVCQEIMRPASRLTNEISLAALKQAANGRVRDCIVELIDALAYGTPEQLIPRIDAVLRIGSSSGTDIAMGIYAGLELSCQYKRRRPMDSCQLKL